MVTARGTDYIQVEPINGQIEFPLQWALLEIKQTYLDAYIFDAEGFCEAINRVGFKEFPKPNLRKDAESILQTLYESLPDPTV